MPYDHNGHPVYRNTRQNPDGTWSTNVWFGGAFGPVTTVRRNTYQTRAQARAGDISDDFGADTGLVRID